MKHDLLFAFRQQPLNDDGDEQHLKRHKYDVQRQVEKEVFGVVENQEMYGT